MRRDLPEAPEKVDPSLYTSTDFKPYVVGDSNPLADKINPSLLKDVDAAARKAGVKVSITTAVSGHGKGSRHETGHAVDIAMVNGSGFRSEKDAEKKGILDGINRFVDALEDMGYTKNTESGNDKAVLTFGFPGHHHHVHVSRKSDDGESESVGHLEKSGDTKTISGETGTDKVVDTLTNTDIIKKSTELSRDEFINTIAKLMDPLIGTKKESVDVKPIVEEINRFKQLIK